MSTTHFPIVMCIVKSTQNLMGGGGAKDSMVTILMANSVTACIQKKLSHHNIIHIPNPCPAQGINIVTVSACTHT